MRYIFLTKYDISYFAVLCAYLGSDLKRLRVSVLLGSIVPLIALLVWDAISLGLSSQANLVVDPVELLMRLACEILAANVKIIQELISIFYIFLRD